MLCYVRLVLFAIVYDDDNINYVVTVLRSKLLYILKNRKNNITEFNTLQFYLLLKITKFYTVSREIWLLIFREI